MTKLTSIIILYFFSNFNVFASETKGVITTIKPIESLVNAVIGDTGKTVSLIPPEISPHEFRLKPSDVRILQNSNIVFYISSHLETGIVKMFKNLPKNIKTINLMEETGIDHLSIRDNEAWELHDHDDHDKHDAKDEKHDDHDKHDAKDDIHIWLDPDNAIKIVRKINKELSLFFPKNAMTYNDNSSKFINELESLKIELKKELLPIKDKPYIVFHDAYQYFERAFELNAIGSIALENDVASSPKQISFIKDKILKSQATCVFQEPQFDSKLVKTVVEGTKVRIGTLDPIGVNILEKENFYLQLLRNMSKSLKKCLG
jgi:zinc transport system substrate-binding protein|tara:strand:- start:272 stop:1222 length:951 start_codon:yes stop_codon:yes gene_type:complete